MNTRINKYKQLFGLNKPTNPVTHALVFLLVITPLSVSADRFDAPKINNLVADFDKRINGDVFNVDFLLAHIRNNARKTIRESGEVIQNAEAFLQDTAVFTNSVTNDTGAGASAGSVIIPVGTTADTIIVINEVQGDSVAIQR